MAYKYTGGETVTVTVSNLASDTIACAYWYTGAVSPTGSSYTIKGLLDDNNNTTNTDFSYNTVLKATVSSPSSTSVTFKTADNIYDETNKRYPKYILSYVKLLPHFHNSNIFGDIITSENIEIRQRQNLIVCSTSGITNYWNRGNVKQYTVNTSLVYYLPSNAYTSTISVSSNNTNVASVTTSIENNTQLPITLKSKGTATITLSPGDNAGGTTRTILVTSKTGVTGMTVSYTGNLNSGGSTNIIVSKTPSNADTNTFTISTTQTASPPPSGTFGTAFSTSSTSGSPVLTFTSSDGLVSKSIKITNYTPSISINAPIPTYNQTFTYSLSNYTGSGKWTFTNCAYHSNGTAKITSKTGISTVKWTPNDGGTAVSGDVYLTRYLEYKTSITFTDTGNSTYFADDIYWRSFITYFTYNDNRTIDLNITNGFIGTSATGTATNISVSAGSTVWARRSGSSAATVTANVSELNYNYATTYVCYTAASATKVIN